MGESLININGDGIQSLEILFMLTFLSLLPSIVVMASSFTRIIISLSFLRSAMGLQATPPNNVLIGIALFLTLFIMTPTLDAINTQAYQPYMNSEITQQQALENATIPLKEFMIDQIDSTALDMYIGFSGVDTSQMTDARELPLTVIIPSFITSELSQAFIIGFLLFLPFLLIDIVVSATLMSMGMIMLPPATISLPFKILLFITVDGWELLFSTLIKGFQ